MRPPFVRAKCSRSIPDSGNKREQVLLSRAQILNTIPDLVDNRVGRGRYLLQSAVFFTLPLLR